LQAYCFLKCPLMFSTIRRSIRLRQLRIAVCTALTVLTVLSLAGSAQARSANAIAKKVGQRVTGVPLTGRHITVILTKKYQRSKATERRVVNDCSPRRKDGSFLPQPEVGYWFFHPHRVVLLKCDGSPMIDVLGVRPRDYNIASRQGIKLGCRLVGKQLRRARKQPGHFRMKRCSYFDAFDGQFQGAEASYGGRVVLRRTCNGSHSHFRLAGVFYASDGRIGRNWCDGSQAPSLQV
jgi:hypothetical protein